MDWPAWVQAVGSVVAIIAAVWIDRGSARRAAKDRRATDAALMLVCSRLVSGFRTKTEARLIGWSERDDGRTSAAMTATFRSIQAALHRFPIDRIPNPDAVLLFVQAIQYADLVLLHFEQVNDLANRFGTDSGPRVAEHGREYLTPMAKLLADIDDELRDLAEPGWRTRVAKSRAQ